MNAKDFIISSLTNISNEIKDIKLRYAYDETLNFHIIEVSPECIRRGNEEYMEMEYNLWESFHQMFPNEDLLISETDDTNNMSNILFENKLPSLSMNCIYPLNFDFIFDNWIESFSGAENNYALAA